MAKTAAKKNMNMKTGDPGGFTIIEVVLVLAIAGLIFLMVFIALPALQRSQRDTQRRDDMARLATAINNYQTNNNGRLPGNGAATVTPCEPGGPTFGDIPTGDTQAACNFIRQYMNSATAQASDDSEFLDPSGDPYKLHISNYDNASNAAKSGDMTFADKIVYVVTGGRCNGENIEKSNNSRDYAIRYKMEGSGTYCKDSQ